MEVCSRQRRRLASVKGYQETSSAHGGVELQKKEKSVLLGGELCEPQTHLHRATSERAASKSVRTGNYLARTGERTHIMA